MAVTSIWPIKGKVEDVIKYAKNPEKTSEESMENLAALHAVNDVVEYAADDMKTEQRMFVTGINCTESSVIKKFNDDLKRWGNKGERVCYHGYQSFAEDEVDAKTAHEIGLKLAKKLWEDRFRVLVATHCNTGHYHNHFVLCAVSFVDGKKFDNNRKDYQRMREESDRLCEEYSLSVITEPRDEGMNYGEWMAESEGVPTLRSSIRGAIDFVVKRSMSKRQFLEGMDALGFIIDTTCKYPKIKHNGTERFVRFKSLGEGYSLEEIFQRIAMNDHIEPSRIPRQDDPDKIFEGEEEPVEIMSFIPLYRSYNRAMDIAKSRPYQNVSVYYLVRQDTSIKRLYEDSLDLVTEHNLKTGEDVINYKAKAMKQIDEVIEQRREMRNLLKRLERSGDLVEADKARYNIGVYSMRLSKLRREVTTCDEVLERSRHVRDNLMRIEQDKFRGKEMITDEHIGRRGGSSRENESKRS